MSPDRYAVDELEDITQRLWDIRIELEHFDAMHEISCAILELESARRCLQTAVHDLRRCWRKEHE